jgi:uncharacterized protein (TIGR02117 family)
MIQCSLAAQFSVISALFLAACTTTMPPRQKDAANSAKRSEEIYVVCRGWHIDIGLEARSLEAPLQSIEQQLSGARYLLFGFGDRGYLLTHHNGSGGAIEALWPGPAVILVTGLAAAPQSEHHKIQVVPIRVTPRQFQAAQEYIGRALITDRDQPQAVARAPSGDSVYFVARHRYSAIFTCNTWAAELLERADLRIDSAGVITASQLWPQVRRASEVAAQADAQ